MAEIKFTLPTVQYGNVKMTASPEELGLKDIADASAVGYAAAVYLNYFLQGFQKGASLDVSDVPTEDVKAPQSYWDATQEEHAKELLNEGLGGVTELPEDGPEGVGTDGDGAAPWAQAPKAAAKKPWDKDADPHAPGGSHYYDPTEGLGGVTELPGSYEDDGNGHSGDEPEPAPWEKEPKRAAKKPWEESGGSPAAEW